MDSDAVASAQPTMPGPPIVCSAERESSFLDITGSDQASSETGRTTTACSVCNAIWIVLNDRLRSPLAGWSVVVYVSGHREAISTRNNEANCGSAGRTNPTDDPSVRPGCHVVDYAVITGCHSDEEPAAESHECAEQHGMSFYPVALWRTLRHSHQNGKNRTLRIKIEAVPQR